MDTKDYFDSIAEKWDLTAKHDAKKIRKILGLVKLEKGSKVIDVGTGTGVMIPYLLELVGNTGKITAIDISDRMIAIAGKKHKDTNVEFIADDALLVDLPEKDHDCIICYSMFPHFEDKEYAVIRLAGFLKAGGRFVICHSQSRSQINALHKKFSDPVKADKLPCPEQIEGYFKKTSLSVQNIVDDVSMFVIIGIKKT